MPQRRAGLLAWFVSLPLVLAGHQGLAFTADPEADRYEVRRTDPASVRTIPGQWNPGRDNPRLQDFRGTYGEGWRVRWNEFTGTPHRAHGGRIEALRLSAAVRPAGPWDQAAILALSEAFVRDSAALLGVGWEELRPLRVELKGGRWVVTLQQWSQGREVVGGRVDLRFSPHGDLLLFGADAYATPRESPALDPAAAVAAASRDMPPGTVPHATAPELVYLPMLAGEPLPPGVRKLQPGAAGSSELRVRPAYRLHLKTTSPPGDWLTYVDAATGAVLWRTNRVRFAATTGTVSGDVHPDVGTATPAALPMRDAVVFAGAVTDTIEVYPFEGGSSGWNAQAPWALSGESVHAGSQAWNDSPGVNYADNRNLTLTSPKINLGAAVDPVLVFWIRLALEDTWDFLYIEASGDNGSTWRPLMALTGTVVWHEQRADLSAFTGSSNFRLRFRLFSDGAVNAGGAWIDDVVVARLGSAVTAADGSYSASATGNSNTVESRLRGPFGQVFNRASGGTNAKLTVTSAGGVANLRWSTANSKANERDTFYGLTAAHARLVQIDPSFTALDYPFPVFVGTAFCNAYYAGWQIVMGAGASGCADLGQWTSVVAHEYCHASTDLVYGAAGDPPSDMHEGFSDYFAATLSDDPRIGAGVLGPGTMFRSIDNKLRYPEDYSGEAHIDGTILAGALWDMRKLLLPDVELADSLFHFARYGAPKTFEDYFLEVLAVDDDDANLGNGTPHLDAIRSAFGRHGIGLGPEFEQVFVAVQDEAGNGDARLDPGEAAGLLLTLRNYGGAETGVSVRLAARTPGVTVNVDSVFLGNVGVGAQVSAPSAFQVSVDASVPVGTAIFFDLVLRSSLGANGDCFMLPAGYVPFLLVDDDRTMNFETWFEASLTRLGEKATRWDAGILGSPSAEMMATYRAVLWFTGNDRRNTLTPADQEELAAYLGAGGRLFLTGEDIGEDLWKGNSGVPTPADKAFYETWLRAKVDLESEGAPTVQGEASDPVAAGLELNLNGGTSANNLNSCSSLLPFNGSVAAMRYSTGRVAALRYQGSYKLLYCGFGFEGITTAAERDTMLARVLGWLSPAEATPPQVSLAQPNGGELLTGDADYTIHWTASDDVAVVAVNLWLSTNGGASFVPIAMGLPNRQSHTWRVVDVSSGACLVRIEALDPSTNMGIDTSDASFAITRATDVPEGVVPRRFALHPAMPNPFNPMTALRFDLPRPARVWLQILSVDGRRVRTLLDGQTLPAGALQQLWNGRDESGRDVASGVYFVRLRADSFHASQKLQLLR